MYDRIERAVLCFKWRPAARLMLAASVLGIFCGRAEAQLADTPQADPDLLSVFREPPQQARPRVWWHWMGGNVDAVGARLDLEWMKRVGVGGFHIFSGDLGTSKFVEMRQPFMSPGWQAALQEAVAAGHTAGMEVGIAGSPGWSHTGGPWVPPSDGMKKLVWSETVVRGGSPFTGIIPRPPSVSGPFQDRERDKTKGPGRTAHGDSYVVAYPIRADQARTLKPVLTASDRATNLSNFDGGAPAPKVRLQVGAEKLAWIEARFDDVTTLAAVMVGVPSGADLTVEADDGRGIYRTLARTVLTSAADTSHPAAQQTISFAPAHARTFRLVFRPIAQPPQRPLGPEPQRKPEPLNYVEVAQVGFLAEPRVDRFEAKAGFQSILDGDSYSTPATMPAIPRGQVIDLTKRLRADGRLDWTPPKGTWAVLRFGWSLTGQTNAPAEPEATGLEVDKLDPAAVRRYVEKYLGMYDAATGGKLGPAGIGTLVTDSWEAGVQNWTPAILDEFRTRRGYDPLSFLPVLAGRVVGSAEDSDRFLWDYRQTLKDMVADNHHAVLAKMIHERGMQYYTEVQGDSPRAIADGMTLKARADIPTAEYWYRAFAAGPGQFSLKADLEEAASAAHVYGKPIAAAEALTVMAMTDPWSFSPRMLKPVADEIFARGINRIIIHDSHHQPFVDKKPGLFLGGMFGQFFNRNETWAEDAKPWIDYLSRTSAMLQQGRFVADVAYFYGEEHNLTELFRDRSNTDVPQGYRYDYINAEALLTLLSVRDGRIVTPSGMSYAVLYMPAHVTRYSLPTLRKVRELVAAGAVVVAPKPGGGLGLAAEDGAVRAIADEVWGKADGSGYAFGKGTVYAATPLAPVLAQRRIMPDVELSGVGADSEILTLHRRTSDADIYYLSNQRDRVEKMDAGFRVTGKAPELWRAETGSTEPLSYRSAGEHTVTSLQLAPYEAVFVVFRRAAATPQWTAPQAREVTLATLDGPWPVTFEPGRGAPAAATFDKLVSWPEVADPAIRYFSGAATYTKQITVPQSWLTRGRRVELDLGRVHELAAVTVNGRRLGTAWHAPYKVDLTGALRRGANRIEIRVINLWPNRLIGDKQPGAKPVAYAPQARYRANSPLLPSGLIGPVRLIGVDQSGSPVP